MFVTLANIVSVMVSFVPNTSCRSGTRQVSSKVEKFVMVVTTRPLARLERNLYNVMVV